MKCPVCKSKKVLFAQKSRHNYFKHYYVCSNCVAQLARIIPFGKLQYLGHGAVRISANDLFR